jgi:hypothetical protein
MAPPARAYAVRGNLVSSLMLPIEHEDLAIAKFSLTRERACGPIVLDGCPIPIVSALTHSQIFSTSLVSRNSQHG